MQCSIPLPLAAGQACRLSVRYRTILRECLVGRRSRGACLSRYTLAYPQAYPARIGDLVEQYMPGCRRTDGPEK